MNSKESAQLQALALLVENVPEALRDCVASKIVGVLDGVALSVALNTQKATA